MGTPETKKKLLQKIITFILILGPEIFVIGNATSIDGQKNHLENLWEEIPNFLKESYKLNPSSRLKGEATDGTDLGLIH